MPWVNGNLVAYLASTNAYSNNVRIIGKVLQDAVGNAVVEASDGRQVKIISKSQYNAQFICVGGRVLPDATIEETMHCTVEDNFNLNLMNEMIVYTQKYQSLF